MIDKRKVLLKLLVDSNCEFHDYESYVKVSYLNGVHDVMKLCQQLTKNKFRFKINNGLIIYFYGGNKNGEE